MQRSGTAYTLVFMLLVCVVFSTLVSGSAYILRPRQELNVKLDRHRNVLSVSGLLEPGQSLSADEVQVMFENNIKVRIVDLETGQYADDVDPESYNMVQAVKKTETSVDAPANLAGVSRFPKYAVVHQVVEGDQVNRLILEVWGRGLWSTMYAYVALDKDGNTIKGLTFYDQAETPGLGGEVDNPKWKAVWPGRKVYDENGAPAIRMVKGGAGSVDEDPHGFDGISGATITSRSVENLLNLWLGDSGYKRYLESFGEDSI
jgi:Na+-transporting NADH:ubiquinone oxidoreductase subunit C